MLSGNDNDNNNNTASIQLTHWTGLMTEFDLASNPTVASTQSLWPMSSECVSVSLVCAFQTHPFRSAEFHYALSHTHTHTHSLRTIQTHCWWMCERIGVASQSTITLQCQHNGTQWTSLRIFCSFFCSIVYVFILQRDKNEKKKNIN